MRRLLLSTLCGLFVLGLGVDRVSSQNASASLAGKVLTEQGDPVPGAGVIVANDVDAFLINK